MNDQSKAPVARLEPYVDRTRVPDSEPAERFALLLLYAPDAGAGAVHPPLNLSLVIDRSGSMAGEKLEYVKEAAAHALRLLHEADRVSVVIYDDEVQVLSASQPATPRLRDELIRKLRAVHSGGSTDLYGGWQAGCGQVLDGGTDDFINRVLLLTDGLANVGTVDHEAIVTGVKAERRAGITTTTFGVGSDFNQFLLHGMADNGGGHFYFIDQPAKIPALFSSELGEMLTVTARNLVLEIGVPEGVTIDLLNDLPHTTVAGVFRMELGEACAGEVRTLAFRLGLPSLEPHTELILPLHVSYTDAGRQSTVLTGQGFAFQILPAAACEEQPVNDLVLAEAGRFIGERAKMQALSRLYHDDVDSARQILREAIFRLEALLPPELAILIVRELEDVLRQSDELHENRFMAKQAHFASYAVQRSRKR
jgi:Ca-activated chloride channel homolog